MTFSAWRLPRRQPLAASYDDLTRLLCRHVLGRKSGRLRALRFSSAEAATADCRWCHKERVAGVVSQWRDSAKSGCAPKHGTRSHAPHSKPVLMRSISTPTLIQKRIRSKGSEVVAAAKGLPTRYAGSRSSADYVAPGVRDDPRGRKSGAGPREANPR